MAICPICKKEKEQFTPPRVITTAIHTQTQRKTGFKQYTITTRLSHIEKHTFGVCSSCETVYNRILPYAVWAVTIVLLILLAIINKRMEPVSMLFFAAMILVVPAYAIIKLFSLNSRMKRLARLEREQTGAADGLVAYTAYAEREYKKFKRQNQNNKY